MKTYPNPTILRQLLAENCLQETDIVHTPDGFYIAYKSLADILARKSILDFPDSEGRTLPCSNFFDDWFLYAVPEGDEFVYSLLKLREQEHDQSDGTPSDGDTPGVTVCFISFNCQILLDCLQDPSEANRRKLNGEINRVVARRGQRHHDGLKQYFANPQSEGAYLTATLYIRHIAAMAENGVLAVPNQYLALARKYLASKSSVKDARVPRFVASVNLKAGGVICDHEKIFIKDPANPDVFESAIILATHAGNTSLHSFAAEVEYHARFLTPMAKVKIPFFGRSVYDSAIRADMTIGDTEFEGPAPFYRPDSKIVMRQALLHPDRKENFDR